MPQSARLLPMPNNPVLTLPPRLSHHLCCPCGVINSLPTVQRKMGGKGQGLGPRRRDGIMFASGQQ